MDNTLILIDQKPLPLIVAKQYDHCLIVYLYSFVCSCIFLLFIHFTLHCLNFFFWLYELAVFCESHQRICHFCQFKGKIALSLQFLGCSLKDMCYFLFYQFLNACQCLLDFWINQTCCYSEPFKFQLSNSFLLSRLLLWLKPI